MCVQFHLRPDTVLLGLPGGSAVKNLPAVQETRVQSLGWEDPLEEGLATHSSIFSWRIPWTEELVELRAIGSQRIGDRTEATYHTWTIKYHRLGGL